MTSPGDNQTPAPAPRRPRPFLVISLAIALLCIAAFAWVSWPRYLALDIPAPAQHGWYYVAKTATHWSDGGTYYYWRVETRVYTNRGPFPSTSEITRYFDEWLTSNGWQALPRGSLICQNALPDSENLTHDPDTSAFFLPSDNVEDAYLSPVACLSVREIGHPIEGFVVVLVTERPSWLTQLSRELQ